MRATPSPPKLLVLNDLYPVCHHLPNLGDRALQAGFRVLLSASGCQLVSGRWKALPHLTGKAYAAAKQAPETWLADQFAACLSSDDHRAVFESWLARRVSQPISRSGLLAPLDRIARRHTGMKFIDSLEPRFLRSHHTRELVKRIQAADAVVFSGGGLIADHLDNYLPERLFQLYLAKRFNKPVAIANYSLALAEPRHRALAEPILCAIDLHLTREALSAEALIRFGVAPERIISSFDSAFALSDMETQPKAPERKIGLMIRGDRPVDFVAWSELIDRLRETHDCRIHYLQNCRKYDPPVRRKLAKHCRMDDDGRFPDLRSQFSALSEMQLLITNRYHGVVFSILSGVPVLAAQATTHKISGLLQAIDYPLEILPPLRKATLDDYLTAGRIALATQDPLRDRLRKARDRLRHQVTRDYQALFARLLPQRAG